MRPKNDIEKLNYHPTVEEMFVEDHKAKETAPREEFNPNARAYTAGITLLHRNNYEDSCFKRRF